VKAGEPSEPDQTVPVVAARTSTATAERPVRNVKNARTLASGRFYLSFDQALRERRARPLRGKKSRSLGTLASQSIIGYQLAGVHRDARTMPGKYFEEFRVGQVFSHQPGRTVTETDNLLFSALTMNLQPLHLDVEFSAKAEFGQRLVNSIFTLGLAIGVSVADTTLGTTVGNLGFEKVEFPRPVFIGDTICAETEVVDVRESKSRPQWGIVTFEHRGKNQRGEIVVRCRRAAMMRRKPVETKG
jgi:acyl dehydratase